MTNQVEIGNNLLAASSDQGKPPSLQYEKLSQTPDTKMWIEKLPWNGLGQGHPKQ